MASSKPKRVKDTEEMVSGVRRQHRALAARAADEDPWVAAEMFALAAELEHQALLTVRRLREVGYTWTDIGFSMKMTGAACCKKYSDKIKAL